MQSHLLNPISFKGTIEPKVSVEKLWTAIIENLHKQLGKRDRVILHNTNPTFVPSNEQDAVVFTCGHQFSRKEFFETVLPQLKLRFEELPTQIPLTAKLVLAEYHQQVINLACPYCFYNAILEYLKFGKLKVWRR
eukprot:TRINITY_DN11323_c0_g1_i1.p1 TRINITY_DN11323_c0_g1~~TRINITY_DN11323_c0_g1_i1.p1  ORF type:complete len:147 (-),score=39.22 TRINITY_DN11323_c0_g1_i1:5-409(-)